MNNGSTDAEEPEVIFEPHDNRRSVVQKLARLAGANRARFQQMSGKDLDSIDAGHRGSPPGRSCARARECLTTLLCTFVCLGSTVLMFSTFRIMLQDYDGRAATLSGRGVSISSPPLVPAASQLTWFSPPLPPPPPPPPRNPPPSQPFSCSSLLTMSNLGDFDPPQWCKQQGRVACRKSYIARNDGSGYSRCRWSETEAGAGLCVADISRITCAERTPPPPSR